MALNINRQGTVVERAEHFVADAFAVGVADASDDVPAAIFADDADATDNLAAGEGDSDDVDDFVGGHGFFSRLLAGESHLLAMPVL